MIHLLHWTSRWASRHARLAIALIVLFEVVNGFNGVLLGATLLTGVPIAGLYAGVAVLMGLAVGVRWLYQTGPDRYGFRRACLFGAFLGNFLLFGLLGGLMAPRPQLSDGPTGAWGYRQIEMRSDTLRPAEPPTARTSAERYVSDHHNGKKAGFVALFVLSIFLMLYMAGLACSIACSGYGFLAIVVFLLGLGFPAGGIYFLGRATDKPFKTRREMTADERRQTGRRFWLSWGLLAGIVTLLLLISAIASQ